jgi:hypothetical protein
MRSPVSARRRPGDGIHVSTSGYHGEPSSSWSLLRPKMWFTCLSFVAALGGCDAIPTSANAAGSELVSIAVGTPNYAMGLGRSLTEVSPSGAELGVGETLQLLALDIDGLPLSAKWSSSNLSVATVTASGLLTGMGGGQATVTAQFRGQWIDALVTVYGDELEGPIAEPTPDPAPPSSSMPLVCSDYPRERTVQVRTAAELSSALKGALPGDLIELADGEYVGRWTIANSGTPSNPVVLCGTRAAVLRDTRYDGGAVLLLRGAHNWVLNGFTVRTALWAVRLEGSNDNRISSLELFDIGQEAIGIRNQSSRNTVQGNRIYDTGRRGWNYQQWGEGVYIGSYSGQWVNGEIDRSDYNQVLENVIGPNVTAEHIDVKEGTTGTIVRGNTFDGRGMESSGPQVDSWVLVQGNDGVIENNYGTVSRTNGFRVWPGHDGNWGQRNTFRNNTADVQAAGYGFVIQGKDNVIACANVVTNADAGFANVSCR